MRALLLILDGAGVGCAADAGIYGDRGADTLGHVFLHRQTLALPTLFSLGLGQILSGNIFEPPTGDVCASYGRMRPQSPGKDTMTGLWEIAGVILNEPFAVFENFPGPLVKEIQTDAKVEFLGNCTPNEQSTREELGRVHLQTGRPILYAGADSVMQISAHEEIIPRKRLHEICRVARRHANSYRIGRVIAQAFAGSPGGFRPVPGSQDFPMVPPRTVFNAISEAGFPVQSVGKAGDVFARSGITHLHPANSNHEAMRETDRLWHNLQDGLIIVDLPDFDSLHGQGRDLHGFAAALLEFDAWLAEFLMKTEPEDIILITAGHGDDPTFRGTGHTREEVPLIAIHGKKAAPLGIRETFADVASTLAACFDLHEKWPGTAFLGGQNPQLRI